jgi:hypothetical protein
MRIHADPDTDPKHCLKFCVCFPSNIFSGPTGHAWKLVFRIRIRIRFVSWIQIRFPNADPDPAADDISSKCPKNSYYLELFH